MSTERTNKTQKAQKQNEWTKKSKKENIYTTLDTRRANQIGDFSFSPIATAKLDSKQKNFSICTNFPATTSEGSNGIMNIDAIQHQHQHQLHTQCIVYFILNNRRTYYVLCMATKRTHTGWNGTWSYIMPFM